MAATWIKPLHVNQGTNIAPTLADRTDYAENPDKTISGELVAGYACDPRTADEEFLLSKKEYEHITGRDQGRRNILAYHIRQAFKPGEITPEEALEAGYELAARFAKNKHAYIVAVHTDKKHIHCHIVFNSTSLDCTRKFKNFWGSSFAIRRLSDHICMERGLSVIENPKPSKGRDYGDWLGADKPVPWQEQIRKKIDEVLPGCADFESFVSALNTAGFMVKDNRKHISVCAPVRGGRGGSNPSAATTPRRRSASGSLERESSRLAAVAAVTPMSVCWWIFRPKSERGKARHMSAGRKFLT
jgi:hypothetical protein